MFYDQTRHRHDVWKKMSDLWRLEDVWFTSSWRRPIYNVLKRSDLILSWRCPLYVLKTSDLRCFEDVQFTTSWRRLIYFVLKTSNLRRLEDVWLTTSWRHLIYDVLKTSVKRRLSSNVVATSIQRRKKWFFLIIFKNFWKGSV